jgi:hypothetical protein
MKLAAAQSLTAWLWDQHPDLVRALAQQLPSRLGCLACDIGDFTNFASCDLSDQAFSCFSVDTLSADDLSTPTLSCSGLSLDSIDYGTGTCLSTPALTGVSCIPTVSESDLAPVPTCAVTISGGCVPQVCAPVGTPAAGCSATGNPLSGVASFLTSAAGLTALTKVASTYFQAQAAQSQASAAQARMQAAIVNAQTARAATGQVALPISYVATASGTTTPVISTTQGTVPLSSTTLSSLTPGSMSVFLAQYGTWIAVGGAALFLLYAATRRRGAT